MLVSLPKKRIDAELDGNHLGQAAVGEVPFHRLVVSVAQHYDGGGLLKKASQTIFKPLCPGQIRRRFLEAMKALSNKDDARLDQPSRLRIRNGTPVLSVVPKMTRALLMALQFRATVLKKKLNPSLAVTHSRGFRARRTSIPE